MINRYGLPCTFYGKNAVKQSMKPYTSKLSHKRSQLKKLVVVMHIKVLRKEKGAETEENCILVDCAVYKELAYNER